MSAARSIDDARAPLAFTLSFTVPGSFTLRQTAGPRSMPDGGTIDAALGAHLAAAARAYGPKQPTAAELKITPRMLEILQHLCARGSSNRVIAKRLGITASTVKFHMNELMVRLNADNRTHMAMLAVKHGLVTL